jgi:CRP-like cAMP-binding protein
MSRHTLTFNSRNFLKRIGTKKTTREYQDRQAIYSQGDAADSMFYIQNGSVKLVVASPRGKQAVIAILGSGDVFGEGCLSKQSLRMSTATAIQPSTISRVNKGPLVRLVHQDPAFGKLLICFRVWVEWKKTSWIDSSIAVRNAWPGFSYCSRILARKVETELRFPKSTRNICHKWWAPPGRG